MPRNKTIIRDVFPDYYNEISAEILEQQYLKCMKSLAERCKYNRNTTYNVVYEETYRNSIKKVLKGDENTNL
jgi:hypothetical protein